MTKKLQKQATNSAWRTMVKFTILLWRRYVIDCVLILHEIFFHERGFIQGTRIKILSQNGNWWYGEVDSGEKGFFPYNVTKFIDGMRP